MTIICLKVIFCQFLICLCHITLNQDRKVFQSLTCLGLNRVKFAKAAYSPWGRPPPQKFLSTSY